MASSQLEVGTGAQYRINVQSGRAALWDSFVTPPRAVTNGTVNTFSGCTAADELQTSQSPASGSSGTSSFPIE